MPDPVLGILGLMHKLNFVIEQVPSLDIDKRYT